jgi:hypothetical protein
MRKISLPARRRIQRFTIHKDDAMTATTIARHHLEVAARPDVLRHLLVAMQSPTRGSMPRWAMQRKHDWPFASGPDAHAREKLESYSISGNFFGIREIFFPDCDAFELSSRARERDNGGASIYGETWRFRPARLVVGTCSRSAIRWLWVLCAVKRSPCPLTTAGGDLRRLIEFVRA